VLESRLTGGRRTAFQNGRRAVLRQSSALDEETQITKEEVKEAGEKVKEKVVGELTRQSAELATQLDAEQARLAELAKQLNYDLEQIGTEEKQCSQRLQTAQAAAQDAGFRLRDLDGRVAELYDMANREKDPNLRQQILFDAAHWRSLRDRTAAELAARNQQVAIEMAKLRDLQLRRTKINARWQKESGGVAKLEGSLKRTLRDKDRTEKKAVDTLTPQTATQQQRSVALSTYVPLPVVLEKERERVLLLFDSR
jgi:chromosome segregation ATPase